MNSWKVLVLIGFIQLTLALLLSGCSLTNDDYKIDNQDKVTQAAVQNALIEQRTAFCQDLALRPQTTELDAVMQTWCVFTFN